MKPAALLLAAIAVAAACASTPDGAPALFPQLEQGKVQATTATGTHEFTVWIAADPMSQRRGLMYVRDMPPDRGMFFLFEFPHVIAFWMKNTYLSLDIVFIAEDGTVLNIAADAKPLSLDPIWSDGDALTVLEVRGGTAKKIGLKPGDHVSLTSLRTTGSAAGRPDRPASSGAAQG
jgi:uncharacterized membrane protein (UPF0127 family)